MDRSQRWFVGVALPVSFATLTLGPTLVRWRDLPDPMATHFGVDGAADGRMPILVHLALTVGIVGAACTALIWAVWRSPDRMGMHAPVASFVGWLVSWLSAVVVFANAGHDRWQDVTLGSGAVWGSAMGAFGASIPVAMMATRAQRQEPSTGGQAMQLAPDERAAWFGRARSMPLAMSVVVAAFVGSVVLLSLRSYPTVAVLVAVALPLAAFMSVEVTVSARGLAVRSGVFGWPRVRLGLDEIESARAFDLRPVQWGGWGYRGSVRLFRRAAWVIRRGEALGVTLHNGREFAVTVDDAAEAAEVLNGLLSRPTPGVRS